MDNFFYHVPTDIYFGKGQISHLGERMAQLSKKVLLVYGGVLWGAIPELNTCGGVSWQGHLCGAVAGVVAAYLLSGPERKARQIRKRPNQPYLTS